MNNIGFFSSLKTEHFGQHCFRIFLSAIGIQCWTMALANQLPIWQGIALLMTSPLFVTIGSGLFLKEKVDKALDCNRNGVCWGDDYSRALERSF